MPDEELRAFSADEPLAEYVEKLAIWNDELAKRPRNYSHCLDMNECFLEEIVVTAQKAEPPEPITNNQVSGVDEGDIVKRVGDYLVMLRRGRLFSFSLPTESTPLAAVDYIDVGSELNPIQAWYDEILSHGNRVVLIGFSFRYDVSIVRTYDVTDDGMIREVQSFYYRSDDYFSANNYATRLIDGQLFLHFTGDINPDSPGVVAGRIVNDELLPPSPALSGGPIYQPLQHTRYPAMHTVARCDLQSDDFRCSTTSLVGPDASLFYVSADAVYLWLNSPSWRYDYFVLDEGRLRRHARRWPDELADELAVVYRIPHDGGEPTVVPARGWPIDQFSFHETNDSLQVLTRDSEWSETSHPVVVEIPLSAFASTLNSLPLSAYTELPSLRGAMHDNRFVGSSLYYNDILWNDDESFEAAVWAKNLASDTPPVRMELNHLPERIEAVGDSVLVIGIDMENGLGLTPISYPLYGQPWPTHLLDLKLLADDRSHAFNYRRTESGSLIGLPTIRVPDDFFSEWDWDGELPTRMEFLQLSDSFDLQVLGEWVAGLPEDDHCKLSCTDWYGNARPFFVGERIFALMGYELIEGYISGGTLYERQRANGLDLVRADVRQMIDKTGEQPVGN